MSEPATPSASERGLRARVRHLVENPTFTRAVIILIVLNAIILGLETYPPIVDAVGDLLTAINTVIIGIFAVEILLRLYAEGWRYFTNGWNIFDFVVVTVAFIPPGSPSSILRMLRLLRVLRLLSTVRSMRRVVTALGAAMPGILSIGALLVMLIYVFAVASVTLLGPISPTFFGDLWTAIASMFRVALGDGWEDVITPIALEHPWVWAYFMVYGIISSVIVLNLFVAVAVEGMDRMRALGLAEDLEQDINLDEQILSLDEQMLLELRALRAEVDQLRAHVEGRDLPGGERA